MALDLIGEMNNKDTLDEEIIDVQARWTGQHEISSYYTEWHTI